MWFGSVAIPNRSNARTNDMVSPLNRASVLLGLIQSAFFIMGNSNSLSSVDLGNAYIGVDDYNVGVTGLLTFVSNWAGSIWWTFASISIIVDGYWQAVGLKEQEDIQIALASPADPEDDYATTSPGEVITEELVSEDNTSIVAANLLSYYSTSYLYFAIFFSLSLTTLTISVTILRQHLFIWTVFSPKFLFQGAWVILYHFLLQTLLSTVVIGTWIPWCIT